ncbi:hypothetical protein O7599_29480 [Streptomyces sp. WMMC500]|uniref:hypothetical protein n=1 Tax=Streptomyces sp. WMMC500 TaxID=3015154 RepID=UPI00248C75A6|nr:hypothetical protein [Streptomyces sp. WMMC500]WBB59653.1 hypothetical protein O7599_29480 [Streptomyces sp. WMMC500]
MTVWLIIILIVAAVALAALVYTRAGGGVALPGLSGGPRGLRRRFGPEYDRTVERYDGDRKAAEKDLAQRVRMYGKLRTVRPDAAARERYDAEWSRIQEHFVDSPAHAAAEADRLIARLAGDCGYPADEYDERVSALSVHHPRHVGDYRRLHLLAQRDSRRGGEEPPTEEARTALLRTRELYKELAGRPAATATLPKAPAAPTAPAAPDPAGKAAQPAGERGFGRRLADRVHAPRAMRRGHGPGGTTP